MNQHEANQSIAYMFHELNCSIGYVAPYWAVQRSWFARANAFVIFRARSRERLHLPLPGRFLSRRWFTMEVESSVAE